MKVLIDLNVVLDVLLNRASWVAESQAVWDANYRGEIEGHVAATAFTNLHFIAGRLVGKSVALECARRCLAAFKVVPVDGEILNGAVTMNGPDFEDNVVIRCAVVAAMDAIVTRDAADFAASPVPVLSPRELIELLAKAT